MKVGDLVQWKNSPDGEVEVGVILETQASQEDYPDYRMKDAVLVLWHDGHEWVWVSEVVKNEGGTTRGVISESR